jgi:2-(1,2-epoxy-1,2-dihydrophenyl)acetyl-CoA isomerase
MSSSPRRAAGSGCRASLGVFVTGGLTATLPAFAGLARAKGLMLLGEEFGAAEAHAWGLVWQVVPDADLNAAAARVSKKLAALVPNMVSRYKKVLNEVQLAHFQRAVEAEREAQRALQFLLLKKIAGGHV